MNNKISTQFFTVLVILLFGCDPHDAKLVLINNTNEIVHYNVNFCEDIFTTYPRVIKNGIMDSMNSSLMYSLEERKIHTMDTWEEIINECQDSAIRIYFFKKELVENVSEDTFLKRQAYSKKFKLTVKDLEEMNWRVVYDGE